MQHPRGEDLVPVLLSTLTVGRVEENLRIFRFSGRLLKFWTLAGTSRPGRVVSSFTRPGRGRLLHTKTQAVTRGGCGGLVPESKTTVTSQVKSHGSLCDQTHSERARFDDGLCD